MKGVTSAVSGYTGGALKNPSYEQVSTGSTGHAESVRVAFDPSKVSYADLLRAFFSVATDPTELNYQGPDHGTQYRSVLWYTSDAQKNTAKAYIDQLAKAKTYSSKIVTEVKPAQDFYNAEGYHQDYETLHPESGYIAINDAPKVANLKRLFPTLYREQPEEIYLRQLFVVRNRRRQGIGRQAFEVLRSKIWPTNKRLTVEVLVKNEPAVAFWRSVGYEDYSLKLEILSGKNS